MTRGFKKSHIIILTSLLLSGCIGEYPGLSEDTEWTLSVTGYEKVQGKSHIFIGEIRLGGSTSAPKSIQGVQVKFINKRNKTIKTVDIGEMNSSRWQEQINVTLKQEPKYVLLIVTNIAESNAKARKHNIFGLKRTENGDYYRYTAYDPTPATKKNKS